MFDSTGKLIDERYLVDPVAAGLLCGTRSVDIMSKPTVRVAFFLLISLTLIAATYMTVQGAWFKSGATSAASAQVQAHTVSGVQTNLNHDRLSSAEVQSLQMQSNFLSQPGDSPHQGGGCHSESHQSPQD